MPTQNEIKPPVLGTLWTAIPLDDDTKKRITDKISHMIDCEVLLETALNPSLLAGFRVELADRVFDCSLLTQLNDLQQKLNDMDNDLFITE